MNWSSPGRSFELGAFVPKFATALYQGYTRHQLRADAMAALIGSGTLVAVIVALAFVVGMPADKALIAAGTAICIVALLGGSSFQIGAPTVLLAFAIGPLLMTEGTTALAIAMFEAGALLITASLAGWYAWVRHVPPSMIVGLEIGAGIGLAWHAIERTLHPGGAFLARQTDAIAPHAPPTIATLGMLIGSLLLLVLLRRSALRAPSVLLVLIATALMTPLFQFPAETLGDPMGTLVATVSSQSVGDTVPTAFALAFLIGVESLRSARLADARSGRSHRPQSELFAEGIANIAAASLGGLPAGGDPGRAIDGLGAGAQSPFFGILTGLLVLAAALALQPLIAAIPTASLCALLLVLASDMCCWPRVRRQLGGSPRDHALAAMVAILVVFTSVNVAVAAGVVFALIVAVHDFPYRTTQVRSIVGDPAVAAWWLDRHDSVVEHPVRLPADVDVFEIRGCLVFGNAHRLNAVNKAVSRKLRALVLDVGRLTHMDATGMEAFEDLILRCEHERTVLILAALRPAVRSQLKDCGILRGGRALAADQLAQAVRIAKAVTSGYPSAPADRESIA